MSEQLASGQQFDGEAAHCEQVDFGSRLVAFEQFRRDVTRRADQQSVDVGVGPGRLGQSEVHQFHLPVAADHHVARLDVAVDDLGSMCVVERHDELSEDGPDVLFGQRAVVADQLVQAHPVDVFEHDEVGVEHLEAAAHVDDVRVIKRLDDVGFALKEVPRVLVADQPVAQHLQRHGVSCGTDRLVHDRHPASTQPPGDMVAVHVAADQHVAVLAADAGGHQPGQELAELGVGLDQRMKGRGGEDLGDEGFLGDGVGGARLAGQEGHFPEHIAGPGSRDRVPLTLVVLGHHHRVTRGDHKHLLADVPLSNQVISLGEMPFLEAVLQHKQCVIGQLVKGVHR